MEALRLFKVAREYITPVLKDSAFLSRGMLTPEEFVIAGDQLVRTCPTWAWTGGEESKLRPYLPSDKQFLTTRGVPSYRRVNEMNSDEVTEQSVQSGLGDGDGAVSDWCSPLLMTVSEEQREVLLEATQTIDRTHDYTSEMETEERERERETGSGAMVGGLSSLINEDHFNTNKERKREPEREKDETNNEKERIDRSSEVSLPLPPLLTTSPTPPTPTPTPISVPQEVESSSFKPDSLCTPKETERQSLTQMKTETETETETERERERERLPPLLTTSPTPPTPTPTPISVPQEVESSSFKSDSLCTPKETEIQSLTQMKTETETERETERERERERQREIVSERETDKEKETEEMEEAGLALDDATAPAPTSMYLKAEAPEEEEDATLLSRRYDLSITYDNYYRTPRMWLFGYDENGAPLRPEAVFQDIMTDYAHRTVTVDPHPHLSRAHASIHPCQHGATMKRIIDELVSGGIEPTVDQYMFIFLKFIQSVVPTIEYDYTMDVKVGASTR
eukprot:CAMPEP_0182437628 /NCGR_PEP_ID=MMETSP1167-20130531/85173_1 /TAXON_ID=2988 /ORGANISM="Mallomonas Sp, Strain CCMP3275" /LENGTH=511 /DNA_ID=CAMNT_0024630609 /DNA_START=111 /DNA_END=1646 /DNA_ORIENTATION=-